MLEEKNEYEEGVEEKSERVRHEQKMKEEVSKVLNYPSKSSDKVNEELTTVIVKVAQSLNAVSANNQKTVQKMAYGRAKDAISDHKSSVLEGISENLYLFHLTQDFVNLMNHMPKAPPQK